MTKTLLGWMIILSALLIRKTEYLGSTLKMVDQLYLWKLANHYIASNRGNMSLKKKIYYERLANKPNYPNTSS